MKHSKTSKTAKIQLAKETLRSLQVLSFERLGDVQGGQLGTKTWSCPNICTTNS